MITTGGAADRSSRVAWPPMRAVNSSSTIFTNCCVGVRLARTSCPSAFTRTRSVKSFTTWKCTSASSRARRTSRTASSTLRSVILPTPRSLRRVCSSLSLRLSNMLISPILPGAKITRGADARESVSLCQRIGRCPGSRNRTRLPTAGPRLQVSEGARLAPVLRKGELLQSGAWGPRPEAKGASQGRPARPLASTACWRSSPGGLETSFRALSCRDQ